MLLHVPFWVNQGLVLAVLVFAWWKGGKAEQIAAAGILITVWGFSLLTAEFQDGNTAPHYVRTLIRDVLQAAVLIGVALRANRYWAVVSASAAVISVTLSVLQQVMPFHGWTYWTVQIGLMYLGLGAIAVGVLQTWAASRRAARAGG